VVTASIAAAWRGDGVLAVSFVFALIACIEAALIHGHSQPWMYTVLALAMKKANRPQNEIERVLLSGVDFSAVNVGNLLYSAAFLTRYGANDRALDLYRQASLVDPTRLEPYVLALKLAVWVVPLGTITEYEDKTVFDVQILIVIVIQRWR
jgi:hypothetical protein